MQEIVFVLDRSGSMAGCESDTIGGYNNFLTKQQQEDGEARSTTVLFDHDYVLLHDGVDLRQINPITPAEYFVRGSTALLDAVGRTILRVKERAEGDIRHYNRRIGECKPAVLLCPDSGNDCRAEGGRLGVYLPRGRPHQYAGCRSPRYRPRPQGFLCQRAYHGPIRRAFGQHRRSAQGKGIA